jgi:dihydrofolate synthase/folylpolyglutamate synthase
MLHEVLTGSGKKTGLFTSPYVTTATEKIRVGERYISPSDLIRLVEYLKPFIVTAQKGPYGGPSSFEIFFAIALLYFKEQKCGWVVLEVGLGGRYDATNVITNPVVTVITNIDYDHTDILGHTLREIAADKAGIIKSGGDFFTSEQRSQVLDMFREICAKTGAHFHGVGHQSDYSHSNVELVKAISRHLDISQSVIETGIRRMKMPCRFEVMENSPVIVLDGAHNRAKIRSTIYNLSQYRFAKLYLIIAIADLKKDHRAILEPLLSMTYPMHVISTQVRSGDRKSISAVKLSYLAAKYKRKNATLEVVEDPYETLKKAVTMASNDDMILVTGSFFLAGLLREKWFPEDWVLNHRLSF